MKPVGEKITIFERNKVDAFNNTPMWLFRQVKFYVGSPVSIRMLAINTIDIKTSILRKD